MKNFRVCLILVAATFPGIAQTWDNTGNKKLNGTYYFREVTLTSSDAYCIYGTITFSNGTYSINGQGLQFSAESPAGAYTANGSYSISASGYGFIENTLIGSNIYGSVGTDGVFVGSITETSVNDIFIAAPLTSQSTGTLNGPYSISYLQSSVESEGASPPFGALLQMNSNGSGGIGNVNVTAYADSTSATTQTISGVNYIASSGAFALTYPTNNTNLVQGQQYIYSTPDGAFVFGGNPEDFDMLVGVRTGSAPKFGGLYYTAGFEWNLTQYDSTGSVGTETFYGSLNASDGVILGHQRIQDTVDAAYGYTYSDSYTGGSYTSQFLNTQFIEGTDGEQIGVGLATTPELSVSVPAPSFSASGVYISPTGIVNAASYAPFTAGVSPGELVLIYGSNLGPSTLQGAGTLPLPTTLANVKVLINNIAAPIVYVQANQIAVVVPFEVTQANTTVAQFQINNNGQFSNVITEFVNMTTPGVFTQDESGFGLAAALHADGSPVTDSSPAQAGETVAVFMSGLGSVFPSILDGVGAPTTPLSTTSDTFTADISGTTATVAFQGLAPGFAGLYQLNVQIPSGLTAGENSFDVGGPDSYTIEAFIAIGDPASTTVPAARIRKRTMPRGAATRKLPLLTRHPTVTTP
jgi:uncharacterized protein (TIGR03437 family)